jgi:hypothetical protein
MGLKEFLDTRRTGQGTLKGLAGDHQILERFGPHSSSFEEPVLVSMPGKL